MNPATTEQPGRPTVSVVIPVRNGPRDIAACLLAIARSAHAPDEILVVDDGSTDDTATVALEAGARVLRLPKNVGPAAARNRGAEVARGDILFFTDADVRVHPETIGRAVRTLVPGGVYAAVLGSYDETPSDPGFISQYKNLFHHWVHQHAKEEAQTFWTGCGAVRRETFLAIGGFNEGYGRPSIEDIELGFRLRAAGCRIRLDKAMQATHAKRWTWFDLMRTDILLRGAPWIALMLRDRYAPSDLNLSIASKIATLVAIGFGTAAVGLVLAGEAQAVLPSLTVLLVAMASARWAARHDRSRIAAATALSILVSATAGAWHLADSTWAGLPLGLLAALIASHLDLYAFFQRRRGTAFALGVLPMHLSFQACCAASVPIGMLQHALDRRRAKRAEQGPAVRRLPPLAETEASNQSRRTGA
jgi:GT2 family glycosyltransferase